MSSAPMSPITNDSAGSHSRQTSTPPSSPPSESSDGAAKKPDVQHEAEAHKDVPDDDEDEEEDVGTKAKALTNLLKTSSVGLQDLEHYSLLTNQEPHCRSSLRSWQIR